MEDMQVYAEEAIYDDLWSYCDTRYKIAGQWYGMYSFLANQLRQEYTPRLVHFSKPVNSLVILTFDEDGDKVKYFKDMWNEKDYSHEGLGKVMKTLNGDHLTKITRPEGDL